jgi:hypothetical protein
MVSKLLVLRFRIADHNRPANARAELRLGEAVE